MKMFIKYVYVSIVLMLVFSVFSIITKTDAMIEDVNSKLLDCKCSYVVKTDNILIYENDKINIISNNNEEIIEGDIIDHIIYNGNVYLLIKKEAYALYKVHNNSQLIERLGLNYDNVSDINIYNNEIVIVGKLNDNGVILFVSDKLKEKKEKIFEGDKYQEFTHVMVYYDNIYIGGIKSAHSLNPYYQNVGNVNDIKSFIFKLNDSLEIINSCYFNEGEEREKIKSIIKYNNGLSIMLLGENCYEYELSEDLKCINKRIISNHKLIEIETTKQQNNRHVYIYPCGEMTFLCYYNSEGQLQNFYELDGEYLDYYMNNGRINISYIKNEKTYKIKFFVKVVRTSNPYMLQMTKKCGHY